MNRDKLKKDLSIFNMIHLEVLRERIYIVKNEKQWKKLKEIHNDFRGWSSPWSWFGGMFIPLDCGISIIALNEKSISIISHECTHAIYTILHERGIKLDVDNHEILAYYIGYLTEEVKKNT